MIRIFNDTQYCNDLAPGGEFFFAKYAQFPLTFTG